MRDPLDKMVIRTALHESLDPYEDKLKFRASPVGGSFGKVRSSGSKAHAGWDLYSAVGSPTYAITDGIVVSTRSSLGPEECEKNSYGNSVCILLTHTGIQALRNEFDSELFAFYGHLSDVRVSIGDQVREGMVVGSVGRSGNACKSPSHLHFEIRTVSNPPPRSGLKYRIDPGFLLGFEHYSSRA